MTTKEKILLESLRLFSKNGYSGVSVNDIALNVGITKGALYKHYKNKQDIFDSIILRMVKSDEEAAKDYRLPTKEIELSASEYKNSQLRDITEYSVFMFKYWTEDEFHSLFRKMLTIEQYKSENNMSLYQQYLGIGPQKYLTDIFKKTGIKEPKKNAVRLFSILSFGFILYDGNKANATDLICNSIISFYKTLEKGEN